jgi:opacity protein-like surface antigen
MRFDKIVLLTAIIAVPAVLSAHAGAQESGQMPVFETTLGYTYIHANAPPGQCNCFSANGGFGSVVFNMPRGFSLVADLAAAHASNVGSTTQSITVFNYLFGPRYSFRTSSRFLPYVQILGGGSQEFSNYASLNNPRGAAFSVGGGVSTTLNRHFSWTILEADWVQSRLPNAQNNLQNDLRISSAISFGIGPR